MLKYCLKCSALSEVEQVAFDTACPKCGAIYAKLEEATSANAARARTTRDAPPKADSRSWWSGRRSR
jgi:hypothetical protein